MGIDILKNKKFLFLCLIIILNIIFIFYVSVKSSTLQKSKEHLINVIEISNQFYGTMSESYNYQREFLLTKDEDFLELYYEAKTKTYINIEKLEKTVKYEVQLKKVLAIRELLDFRFSELDLTVDYTLRNMDDLTVNIISTNIGMKYLNEVQIIFGEFIDFEDKLLTQKEKDYENLNYFVFSFQMFLLLFFVYLVYIYIVQYKNITMNSKKINSLNTSLTQRNTVLQNNKSKIESQKIQLQENLTRLNYEKERAEQALEEAKVAEEEAIASQEELEVINESLQYANQAKSEFLFNISHEIRTPLSGIIGIIDILLEENPNETERHENLVMVKNSAHNLKNIINDILDFSKIQAGKFEIHHDAFDLKRMINGISHMFKPEIKKKNLTFNVSIAPEVENFIVGDELRLNQILNNLIGNAVKFTKEGKVELKIKQLFKNKSKTVLRFEVNDTGIGISNKVKNIIFESFSQGDLSNTKKFEGTGLGLAISKELVELMGGKINFESYENVGSKFYIDVTFEFVKKLESNIEADKINYARNTVVKASLKALVAEDSEVNQLVIRKLLENIGFEQISFAWNVEEAIDLLDKENYDVIFMDIQMPQMDGFEATRIIRRKGNQIPIIALSAAVLPKDTQECFDSGMNDHVKKPIDKQELLIAIGHHFELEEKNSEVHTNKDSNSYTYINIQDLKDEIGFEESEIFNMLNVFYHEYNSSKNIFKDINVKSKDFKALVHKIKGTSANLKLQLINKLCLEIEKQNEIDVLERLLSELTSAINNTCLEIKKEVLPHIEVKELNIDDLKKHIEELILDLNEYNFIDETRFTILTSSLKNKVNQSFIDEIEKLIDESNNDKLVEKLKALDLN